RGKENVYTFSSGKEPSSSIGQGLIPEQIEDIKLIFENVQLEEKDTLSEDYISCPKCENRFAKIEDYFANNVIDHFKKNNVFITDTRSSIITRKSNNRLVRLYVYGLFWRASISKTWSNFKMDPKDEEKLRRWLDELMEDDLKQTLHNVEQQNDIT